MRVLSNFLRPRVLRIGAVILGLVLFAQAQSPAPGDEHPAAPNFKLTTSAGEKYSLKQFSGRVVVLDFWATWCPPCVAELPEIAALLKEYPQLVVISIAPNDKEDVWRAFIGNQNLVWPQFFDRYQEMLRKYKVERYPTYVVIDARGRIHARIVGVGNKPVVDYRLREALRGMEELR